jgi:hypothetical protein
MLGLSDLTERFYSHGILLSIPKYLLPGNRQPFIRDQNVGEEGFSYIEWTHACGERFDLRLNER